MSRLSLADCLHEVPVYLFIGICLFICLFPVVTIVQPRGRSKPKSNDVIEFF